MLKFLYSTLLFFCFFNILAQEKEKKQDTIKPQPSPRIEYYGLRLGVDITKIARTFYEKDYKGLEIVGDYRLTKNMYLAAEIGNENKTVNDPLLNFTTKGTYFKVGFDHNGYENWLNMRNIIHIGMRYGVSSFSQNLNSFKIYDVSNYFYPSTTINPNTNFAGLSAQWAEVVAGVKAEFLKNFYVGFSVRMNYLVTNKLPDNFDNLYIPGFNRTYNGKFGAGWNYTISYFIPIYKTKTNKNKSNKKDKTEK